MKQNVSHITSLSKNTHFSRFASGKFNNLEVEDAEIGIFYFSLKRLLSLYLGENKHCSSFGFEIWKTKVFSAIQIQIESEYFDYINRNSEA